MNILDRYFVRRWAGYVLATLTVCLLLFLLGELFGLMDHVLDRSPSPWTLLSYLLHRIVYLVYFLVPLALLIGGFWFLHVLRERNEWTVVLTAGATPVRVLRWPLLGLVILFAAAVVHGILIMPSSGERMERLREQAIKGKPAPSRRYRSVHLKLRDGRNITFDLFLPEAGRIRNVRVTRKRRNRIVERWDASMGHYDPGSGWILRDVLVRRFREDGRLERREESRRGLQLEPPGVLATVLRNNPRRQDLHPSRYALGELLTAVRFRTERGMNTLSERVYLHWKFGFPLVIPLLGLGGILMGLYSGLGRTTGIGACLLGGFGYWLLYNTILALGQSPGLQSHPLLAAWAPLAAVYGPPVGGIALLLVLGYRRGHHP